MYVPSSFLSVIQVLIMLIWHSLIALYLVLALTCTSLKRSIVLTDPLIWPCSLGILNPHTAARGSCLVLLIMFGYPVLGVTASSLFSNAA